MNNTQIIRDYQAECKDLGYTYYTLLSDEKIIGIANYRKFNSSSPYWYIDRFEIDNEYRNQGGGSQLLQHIILDMWKSEIFPIHIYPTGEKLARARFIDWLIKRGFTQRQEASGHIFCVRYPDCTS